MKALEHSASRTVSFSCDGFRLYGSLHLPDDATSAPTGLIVLNQGPLDRSGAHRMSAKLADRLNGIGLPVLRFDARGVGESEGDWTEPDNGEPINALYRRIFNGAWKDDTLAAIDYFAAETGVRRVLLAGLCGGAATALHAGAVHEKVAGIAMVAMPIRLQADSPDAEQLVDSYIRSETSLYMRKLLTPAAWKRFLTFDTDYKTLRAVLMRRLRDLTRRSGAEEKGVLVDPEIRGSYEAARRSRKRILFVYPENDYLWNEFRDLFMDAYPPQGAFELTTIPQANHTFTETSWQEALYTSLTAWAAASVQPAPAK